MKKLILHLLFLSLFFNIACEQNDGPPESAVPIVNPKNRIFGPKGIAIRQERSMGAEQRSVDQNKAVEQHKLAVRIEISPELKERTRPEQIVFIFAKAIKGPKAPLAVVRLAVEDLPETVTLDDSMAMSPMFTISKFDQIYVSAKISLDGQAMTKSGDMISEKHEVDFNKPIKELSLTINQIVP